MIKDQKVKMISILSLFSVFFLSILNVSSLFIFSLYKYERIIQNITNFGTIFISVSFGVYIYIQMKKPYDFCSIYNNNGVENEK